MPSGEWRFNAYWNWRRLVAAADVARLRWRAAAGDVAAVPAAGPFRKVFVAGCPRSGTTWIGSMLLAHPDVVGGGESHAYPQILDVVTELGLTGDAAWRHVLRRYDRMRARHLGVGLHRYVDRRTLLALIAAAIADRDAGDEAVALRLIRGVFEAFYVAQGRTDDPVFVEKSPQHVLYADRILTQFPEARMVEVVRDGRDVCLSLAARGKTQDWAPRDRRAQIEVWRRYVTSGQSLQNDPRFAGRVLRVRYEDARLDPRRTVTRLLEFASLDASPARVESIVAATAFEHHARTGPGRHNWRGIAGGWRQDFSPEDHAVFEELAGPLLRELGYDDR